MLDDDNDNDEDNDEDDDDTHPAWIIVRDGKYSVADKNLKNNWAPLRNAGIIQRFGKQCRVL